MTSVFLLLIWVGIPGLLPAVAAQERSFQGESEASYTFGQAMHFTLRAKSADPMREVTLFFNTPQMESTYSVDFDVESAQEIVLEHDVHLTQVQLAPFTTVRYWWRVVTEQDTFTVEEQTLSYVDDRFTWREVTQGGIEIFWTGDSTSLGQTAMDVVQQARPRLEEVLPASLEPLRVYIYPSMADLRSALRLTGRDWVGAETMPELDVVLVTAVNPRTAAFDLGQSIPHELSHLLLYRTAGANYESVPRWFDEGLATVMEAAPDPSYDVILQQAVAAEVTIPMIQLCQTFPSGEVEARLAYAQSAALVDFIRAEYGNQALRQLVQAYADGADCESGVRRALVATPQELEDRWLAQEQPVPALERAWQEYGLWLLLLGSGFGMMGLLLLPLKGRR